jgi:hypothetical protein
MNSKLTAALPAILVGGCLNILVFPQNAYSFALAVTQSISFNGNAITIDSFDSYGTNVYNAAMARDNGDLLVLTTNTVSLGNAVIRGTVYARPGGSVAIGSQGIVGDSSYVADSTNYGSIQPGHFLDNANCSLADVTLPSKIWLSPVPGNYQVTLLDGTRHYYKYLLNNNAAWKLPIIDGNVYVNSPGVILWVVGDAGGNGINLGSSGEIRIPAGKSISIYMGAPNASLSASAVANDTGVAQNFRYLGLPSNTSITFSGNA